MTKTPFSSFAPVPGSPVALRGEFPLYILAAHDRKGMRIRCDFVPTQQGRGVEGIMAFLNPVDAHMDAAASPEENWQVAGRAKRLRLRCVRSCKANS